MALSETLAEIKIPVYGIVDLPDHLACNGLFVNNTDVHERVTLLFKSTRWLSLQIETGINDVRRGPVPSSMLKMQRQPLRIPFVWDVTVTLDGRPFCGTIHYYASPVKLFGFQFKSEELFLSGFFHGTSCDEGIELLEGLQVLNGRADVIKQYDEPRV